MNKKLNAIRESERKSHIKVYTEEKLYHSDGWLKKPINTVLEIIPMFESYDELHILDLGCGVGRNCFPFALKYKDKCHIDAIDILDIAIEKLNENAQELDVSHAINGTVSSIENFTIMPEHYDFIMAISALEHIDSAESFNSKLIEIKNGLRENGIACFVINTEIREYNVSDRKEVEAQFEVNLHTEELISLLLKVFDGFTIFKKTISPQKYEIQREDIITLLESNVVTFTAQKQKG